MRGLKWLIRAGQGGNKLIKRPGQPHDQPPLHGIVDLLSQTILSAIAGQQYDAKEVEK